MIIKQPPFLNIDDECWYQKIDYWLNDMYLYSEYVQIETGRII